ncbi:N-acetylneuraminate synthase [Sporosarcina sp. GW1-11]|uniref:N-acetylneuraminate synthase n=1 Tax=Sporosarcina sp. GW1-11 TaxID=2899126 RepID=UPI00294D9870|nr:N-acetylneuraminate synthase [Sporosarcina sp. GW1-11]MDV6376983.1 N-acetylneuraminate synthase [Sporosarcina sp. GW1-11]
MRNHTYIIAEAGVNHNGSLELAKQLVDVAKEAGADAVKFQTFKTENLVTKSAKQAAYQVDNIGEATSQFDMLKSLELSYEQFIKLNDYCKTKKIEFLSTPFDFESVDFLLDDICLSKVKIPSGELTNSPFIHYIATKRKSIIISTGMATLDEIHEALSFLAYGLAFPQEAVDLDEAVKFYRTDEAKDILKKFVTVLHCTTEYPAPYETINLQAINKMSKELQLPTGFSDHSVGIAVPLAAAALGATVIEKHFTLNRALPGPDHKASLEPKELKEMVSGIRAIEQSLGDGIKVPTNIECENRMVARKSIVAKKRISIDEIITEAHLTIKRPGNGMEPSKLWSIVGRRASKSYNPDELIDE